MKKTIQILIFVLFSFSAFAQEKKDTSATKESKWSIQLLGGPDYTFPSFYFNSETPKGLYKYSFTLLANIKINNISSFNFGVGYNSLKYKTWLSYNPFYTNYYSYTFYNLFATFEVQTKGKKLFGSFDLGLAGDLLNNNRYLDKIDNISTKFFTNGSVIGSFIFSLGINYKLNKQITLNFIPRFSFAFIPLTFKQFDVGGFQVIEKNYIKYIIYNIGIQYNL